MSQRVNSERLVAPDNAFMQILFPGGSSLNRDYFYGVTFGLLAVISGAAAMRGGMNHCLWWPGVSFGIVSIAYLSGDVRWFGKRRDGTRGWLATIALLFLRLRFQCRCRHEDSPRSCCH